MGAMNKGGNGIKQCTMICNPKNVYGDYHCPLCKVFCDDKKCICCGSSTTHHSLGTNNSVAGINRQQQSYQHHKGYVSPNEAKRRRKIKNGYRTAETK